MTKNPQTHAVTGAFGYSGSYIAKRLIDKGHKVITLTNSPKRPSPLQGHVKAYPLDFANHENLTESLKGVTVLYNTYWVRFKDKDSTHADAVKNTIALFKAAKAAGVTRLVHISILNPALDSPLEYFQGKALLEQELQNLGISYAILRPAVIFGKEDILINNIAWALRYFPIIGLFGKGDYRLQPIFVDDLAKLAVEEGEKRENTIVNAIGPETFSYKELIQLVSKTIKKRRLLIPLPPIVAYMASVVIGKLLGDIVLTKDEMQGLMANLLCVDSEPTGETKLSEWVAQNAKTLGMKYASELARRKRRDVSY